MFHFMCGFTGSAVCLDCFTWVALVDSLLCRNTLGVVSPEFESEIPVAVSGMGVLIVQILSKVVGCMEKACGHLILGTWMYPIAFDCVLPSIIGPVVLVT